MKPLLERYMKIIFFLLLFSLFFNSIYVSVQCIIYITVKKSCKYGTSCEINSVLGTVVIPLPGQVDWPGTFQVSQKCCYACGWKKCHNSIENQYFEQFWTPKVSNAKCDYFVVELSVFFWDKCKIFFWHLVYVPVLVRTLSKCR